MIKKKFIILIVILSLLSFYGCKKKGQIVTKTASEIIDLYNNKDSFLMYVGTGDCAFCYVYTTSLQKIAEEYGIDIYYFDYNEFFDNEETVQKLIDDCLIELTMTPESYIVVEGITVESYIGNKTYEEVLEKLINNKIISN